MEADAIIGLVKAIPAILQAAQQIRATLSASDQAALDAALAAAQATAGPQIDKAVIDLDAAS